MKTCGGCGACCLRKWRVYLSLRDYKRVPRSFTETLGRYRVMRQSANPVRCAAFNMKTRKCVIYSRRPFVCRDFNPGNDNCLMSIRIVYGTEGLRRRRKRFKQ